MRIGILEAGRNRSPLVERFGLYTPMFHRFLSGADPGLGFRDYRAMEGELPGAAGECDAYVVTGGRDGVLDRRPWMAPLQGFAAAAAAAGRPVLGICLGHQLLADAFGGTVEKATDGWGVGIHRYALGEDRPWLDPPVPGFTTVVFHQDQVTAPPPGATVLASSDFCPFAMLEINDHVLTLQSHPEMPADFAAALIELRRQSIGDGRSAEALVSLDSPNDKDMIAGWLVKFLARRRGDKKQGAHSS